jgi:hypothetical protein
MATPVKDWLPLKQRALWVIFGKVVPEIEGGISSDLQLARVIAKTFPLEQQAPADGKPLDQRFSDAMRKWSKSAPGRLSKGKKRPSYSTTLMRAIIKQLNELMKVEGNDGRMTADVFIHATYEEFCEALPATWNWIPTRNSSNPFNSHSEDVNEADEDDEVLVSRRHRDIKFELASSVVRSGIVDQKFYYRTLEAVDNWEGVISAGSYPLYEWCKDSLTGLAMTETWKAFFRNGGGGIVMLGAGGASKDLVMIRGALNNIDPSTRLNYTIIDISHFMSTTTHGIVHANLHRDNLLGRVDLRTLECDFVNLHKVAKSVRRRSPKPLAWILPGSTIGNLNEYEFLRSVSVAMRPGDLLIIGAETLSSGDDKLVQESAGHYRNQAVRTFLSPALIAIWQELKTSQSPDQLARSIRINARHWPKNPYSKVPRATTIEQSLPLKDGAGMVLLTSTKYEAEELISFVEQEEFGFARTTVVPTRLSDQYQQFVFRLVPKGSEP